MKSRSERYYTPVLGFLLLACIVRFWLLLLPESFWIDETVTAFILRHGISHPSLTAGPPLGQTIYYALPWISQALFGFSEITLRLPSLILTLASLYLIARLATRFIHPQAGWIAVFLCFIPREFTRLATDARPYGLGTFIALCAICFLIRWLDRGKWIDAALFAILAALLLRVHLIYWPFYAVIASYAFVRYRAKETPVSGRALAAVFALVAASLLPLIPVTLSLSRNAGAHVVTEMPTPTTIFSGLQFPMIGAATLGLWLLAKLFHWPRTKPPIAHSGIALLLIWWLWQPICLLAFSYITGNSVFLPRYFSLALPGAILIATLAFGYTLHAHAWKPAATVLAAGILIMNSWKTPFPPTRNSQWREAAATVDRLVANTNTPLLLPSPFVEGQPPFWTPAYTLPGFLYAHLDAYPIQGGTKILLPARLDPPGEQYAAARIRQDIVPAGRFVIYGGSYSVSFWLDWLATQPDLANWDVKQIGVGEFGDVEVVVSEARKPKPQPQSSATPAPRIPR